MNEYDELSAIELIVPEGGERLDSFAAANSQFSRSLIKKLTEAGAVTVNGAAAKPGGLLRRGDTVRICPPPPVSVALAAQDIPLDIVYQDADIAVINKPVGMVVHPAAGNPDGTLVNALMHHIGDLSGIGGELRPGIVHRIDKNTSGLLVIAKNDEAHRALSEQLKTHSLSRVYIALADGNFKEDSGTVDAPIARHPADRKRMAVVQGGRAAVTHWRVIERFGFATLLRAELETGRTHQIRVHMAYIHHPLVGDDVYAGSSGFGFKGQALHAAQLTLLHPRSGELMRFYAPLPAEFRAALDKIRRLKRR